VKRTVRQIAILIGVVALVGSSIAAYAQPCAYSMERVKQDKMERIMQEKEKRFQELAKELNLSEEQEAQLKECRQARMETVKTLHEELVQEMEKLRAELEKPVTDKRSIARISTRLKILKGEMFDQRIEGILELKEVLTPEQFQQLSEKRKAKREKFKKFHIKKMKERSEGGLY